jgi:glycosyltransferase involved in cell wall biosynthesis
VASEIAPPAVSVIVFARENIATLPETLRSLEQQHRFEDMEVILADGCGGDVLDPIAQQFPWVRRLRLAPTTMPRLKEAAISEARGEIIAILDPSDAAEPDWIDEILAGLAEPSVSAVGGSVMLPADPTAHSGANRAAYLFEYGCFNPPVAAGATAGDLPGNNVAYRRKSLVEDCADILSEAGFNKPFCHARIRERGGSLVIRPAMRIRHLTRYGFFSFGLRRYHYGRCFGANRRTFGPPNRQLLYRIFAPAVPVLLVLRHLSRHMAHPGNRRYLSNGTPALVGVCLLWGIGEWLGDWFGAGKSSDKLY